MTAMNFSTNFFRVLRARVFPGMLTAAGLFDSAALAQTYTVTDLGKDYRVDGFQSRVLNDAGQVIGNQIGLDGHGFLYSGGTWNDLGQLNNTAMNNHGSIARGLNNAGVVVGQSDTGNSTQCEGFFRNGVAGTITSLGLAANANQDVIAYGVNESGLIVGNVIDYTQGTRDTFVFKAGTGVVSRKTDGRYSFGINQFGDVLGATVGLTSQATLNGNPLPVITNGLTPTAINNAGQILLSVNDTHPFNGNWGMIYDYGTGKAKPLGNLSPQSGGYTTFLSINDAGQVVGRGSGTDTAPHAVFFDGKKLISLDDLDLIVGVGGPAVHLTEAHGINNKGQIVCLGYTTDPDEVHAYLLSPPVLSTLPLAATYDGIASVGGMNRGSVKISVSKSSSSSVKLLAPGVSYSFTAKLVNDAFNGMVTVKGKTLTVALQVDAAHRTVTGSISDGTSNFDLDARRQAKLGIFKGTVTALLQIPGAPNPSDPQGTGFGTVSVSKTGGIKVTGQLGDATKYSVSATLHTDGTWTFYAPLYAKTATPGGIAGFVTFDRTATETDCKGTLRWSGPGIATDVDVKGAYFTAVKNTQFLRFTNTTAGVATFTLAGGEQTVPAHMLSVSNKNVVTVTDAAADNLTVKLSAKGALTGSFIHTVTGKKTTFSGVLQQKLNVGGGVFMGQTTAGSVSLVPAP
jgi:hypothetical protein